MGVGCPDFPELSEGSVTSKLFFLLPPPLFFLPCNASSAYSCSPSSWFPL